MDDCCCSWLCGWLTSCFADDDAAVLFKVAAKPHKVVVYVPSTSKGTCVVPDPVFAARVRGVAALMATLFGGATATVISEPIVSVASFASSEGFAAKVREVERRVRERRDEWGQHAMGIEVDGIFDCI